MLNTLSPEDVWEVAKVQDRSDNTSLHYLVGRALEATIKYLLDCLTPDHQIQLLQTVNNNSRTPLDIAVHNNRTDIAVLLKQYKSSAKRSLREALGKQ